MTTSVTFRFLTGRYHATPWGRNVNEGAVEWPPSCWRLLRALYATWKDRVPHLSEDVVHRLLGQLAVAPYYVVPRATQAHTRHYMPEDHGTTKVLDAFVAVDPEATLVVRWKGVTLSDDEQSALAELVGQLTYLGRSESVCEAEVADVDGDRRDVGPHAHGEGESEGAGIELLVPDAPLDIERLIATTRAVRKAKTLRPPGARAVPYVLPVTRPAKTTPRRAPRPGTTAIRFALAGKTLPTRLAALALGDALRQAAINKLPESAVVTGHRLEPDEGQHRHAHYLTFSVDPANAGRLLDSAVVWAPGQFSDEEVDRLLRLSGLWGRRYIKDFRPVSLAPEAVGPVEEVASELAAASTVWESFTPFAPPRHWKKQSGSIEDYVRTSVLAELAYRDNPPADVEFVAPAEAKPPVPGGWLSFRRHRPSKERLQDAAWAYGVRLRFSTPVAGPIALGKWSHMGLGLFLPVGSR